MSRFLTLCCFNSSLYSRRLPHHHLTDSTSYCGGTMHMPRWNTLSSLKLDFILLNHLYRNTVNSAAFEMCLLNNILLTLAGTLMNCRSFQQLFWRASVFYFFPSHPHIILNDLSVPSLMVSAITKTVLWCFEQPGEHQEQNTDTVGWCPQCWYLSSVVPRR